MAEEEIDIDSLSDEQKAALQQCTSVTDQEPAAAARLLQKCEWNVQIAITRFFDGEPAVPEEPPEIPVPQAATRTSLLHDDYSEIRRRTRSQQYDVAPRIVARPANRAYRQPPLLLTVLFTPVSLAYSILSRVINVFSYFFPFLPRLLSRLSPLRPVAHAGHRAQLEPQDASARFIREFAETYGTDHGLPLMDTQYAQAYDIAKRDLKFLLVVPLSPEHDDTPMFVRTVLLNAAVHEYLNQPSNNILLWAGSVSDSEPSQVSTALNIHTFPAAVVVVHTPSVSSSAMSIVARPASGPVSAEDFLANIQAAVSQHAGALERARNAKREQEAARNLREQQNSAYERSLAQDRERARLKREQEEEKARQEKEAIAEEERLQRYEHDLRQWKRWRASKIDTEPPASDKDVVRLSLRLLDGERVVRRFPASVGIEEVYAFVECQEEINAGSVELSEKEPLPPAGFEHYYNFRLVSPMPREEYDLKKSGTLRQRVGRSANLIAERIEEDDEDLSEDE